MTRTHVSLFAGIGAMDIAAESCGYETAHCLRRRTQRRKQRLVACGNALVLQVAATRLEQLDRLMT